MAQQQAQLNNYAQLQNAYIGNIAYATGTTGNTIITNGLTGYVSSHRELVDSRVESVEQWLRRRVEEMCWRSEK